MSTESPVAALTFKVHHTMLPVANLNRSIDFYTRLLGMTLQERHPNPTRGTDVGLLGYGEEARGLLELTQDITDQAPAEVTPANIHIGIHVSDLHRLVEVLEGQGVTFSRPLRARADGTGFGAWIKDPDGHDLELVERHV
jgi:lactoylglutathione lyase